MTAIWIAIAGFVSWIVSTLSGGGGALLLAPAVSYLVGPRAVAPVATLTSVIASPGRIWLFRRFIDWKVVEWYLPGAIPGAIVGAWLFATLKAEWLQIVVAIFLISTVWQFHFGERQRAFRMPAWGFLPLGLIVSFFSGLIGTTGPVLNPFYLSYGAEKEEMIATKSVNSLIMQLTKIGTFLSLSVLPREVLVYGGIAGIAAFAANWVGRRWLQKISRRRFRQFAIAVMVVSGLAMLWNQRGVVAALWHQ